MKVESIAECSPGSTLQYIRPALCDISVLKKNWPHFVWPLKTGLTVEACIGVLGIQDICHFTSRDIGYYPFYF